MEKAFEYKHVVDYTRVKCTATRLTEHALAWWDDINNVREFSDVHLAYTWEAIKFELSKEFFP